MVKQIGSIAALILVANSVQAAPIFFTDRSLFDASSGGGLGFESFEDDFSNSDAIAFSGFTVSETDGGNILAQVRNTPNFGLSAANTDGTGALGYDDNGNSVGNFLSFTNPVTAFGLDITTSRASSVTIGGSVSDSVSLGMNTPSFWGVIETAGISSLSFDVSGGPNVAFDAVSYGQAEASTPVPAPATVLLFGFGLAGLAWSRRKAKA